MAKSGMSAPFPWFGGKHYMVPTLLPLLPQHQVYVEVFGGGASLLFAKPRSSLEVYNDLDSGLVNFFRVLRDPEQSKELQRRLVLTPYAREEYAVCYQQKEIDPDPIERARMWYTAVRGAFSGVVANHPTSWCHQVGVHGGANAAMSFVRAVDCLSETAMRFRGVQVEHKEACDVIAHYDAPSVLFYCDPPYVLATRKGHGYHHEMDMTDHERLLLTITQCQGMVILSGYDHPLYTAMLPDWQCIHVLRHAYSAGLTRGTGRRGKGSASDPASQRIECIWIKPNALRQPTLFAEMEGE